jgi:transcriptional regulator with XRE-family HTH domain
MPTIHQSLSKNVKRLLAKNRTTVEQLSLDIDKDKAHMSRVLSGKKKASLDLVELIAAALKVEPADLFRK